MVPAGALVANGSGVGFESFAQAAVATSAAIRGARPSAINRISAVIKQRPARETTFHHPNAHQCDRRHRPSPHDAKCLTSLKVISLAAVNVNVTYKRWGALGMSTFASRKYSRATKPFWKDDAFWIVLMPTSLVAVVFLLGMIAKALGN
jgi:hypothetical protein